MNSDSHPADRNLACPAGNAGRPWAAARRLAVLIGGVLALLLANPTPSDAQTRLAGDAYYDAVQCPGAPAGYEDFTYTGLVLTGSIEGCLYSKTIAAKETPSGVYVETGEEVVVGSLNGGPAGTFTTTYRFESKWDPDIGTGVEVHGRCQHPITEGSGTGGFEGATGRLDFKDIIGDPVTYVYRGHISLTGGAALRPALAQLADGGGRSGC